MRKRTNLFDRLLLLSAVILIAVAVYQYAPFYLNDRKMDRLRNEVIAENNAEDSTGDSQDKNVDESEIDWDKLQKKNSDIIAWIKVPGTKIDYPILKCSEWNEYLHTDYKNEYNYVGSIFIQPKTSKDFTDRHTIIYGHNMANKSMFGSLHNYEGKKFWKNHKYFYIHTPTRTITCKVYSTYDCKDTGSTYITTFADDEEWADWIGMTVRNRYYETKSDPGIKDKIITLSTCSNGRGHNLRYVVHGIITDVNKY